MSDSDQYCEKHDLDYGALTGYDHCPKCREEERIEQMEMERMARRSDPNMHNHVDAKANAIDHGR